jgi:hypothetical protein
MHICCMYYWLWYRPLRDMPAAERHARIESCDCNFRRAYHLHQFICSSRLTIYATCTQAAKADCSHRDQRYATDKTVCNVHTATQMRGNCCLMLLTLLHFTIEPVVPSAYIVGIIVSHTPCPVLKRRLPVAASTCLHTRSLMKARHQPL